MIGAVVIGRNEGARLVACLASLQGQVDRIVYVDSGSTDNSVAEAKRADADVILLDNSNAFTAARARNAGFKRLCDIANPTYVQFVDGDCSLREGWINAARKALDTDPKTAIACGRRRERFPDATLYNRLIDLEWDTPVGAARACGGDAFMRADPLIQVGGYNNTLIAGEEPELCFRLRQAGWNIQRIPVEMTWHDAALRRFSQWWQRSRRAGHAYAEGAALHGGEAEGYNRAPTRRALLWGGVLPLLVVLGGLWTPAALLLLLAYPAQIMRLHLRGHDWGQAVFLTIGKFAEAQGALGYYWRNLTGARHRLIEYK